MLTRKFHIIPGVIWSFNNYKVDRFFVEVYIKEWLQYHVVFHYFG